jgi:2'-5' RNA ligase
MKRLFIAINLPNNLKNIIQKLITDSPINKPVKTLDKNFRWIPAQNWHITITFLGNQPETAIPAIIQSTEQTLKSWTNKTDLVISFEEFVFAPNHNQARMLWLKGSQEASQRISLLKKTLENILHQHSINYSEENRIYTAHVTLARFTPAWLHKENLKKINQALINFNQYIKNNKSIFFFKTQSLDIMASSLRLEGAQYNLIQKIPLN